MSKTSTQIHKSISPWDIALNTLRQYLIQYRLNTYVSGLRAMWHFGPWRNIARFLISQLRPACTQDSTYYYLPLDADSIVREIRHNSMARAGVLPAELVQSMRNITDKLPVDHYLLTHQIDENINRLAGSPEIMNVLRRYFKSEPVLLESTIMVTSSNQDAPPSLQNSFHIDYAGWESLNVFIYLTDVDEEGSCHIIAKGSHRKIRFRDAYRGTISDQEAEQRFAGCIEAITGPAGTLIFENTEAFHRRNYGNSRRVMLNLLYASHRGWFSYGRASQRALLEHSKKYRQSTSVH